MSSPFINISGVNWSLETARNIKLLTDMVSSPITVKVDEANEAVQFISADGRVNPWVGWEHLPAANATWWGVVLDPALSMPYGCQL